MYCKHCGKEIADDAKFCQHCGGRQETVSVTDEVRQAFVLKDETKHKIAKEIVFIVKVFAFSIVLSLIVTLLVCLFDSRDFYWSWDEVGLLIFWGIPLIAYIYRFVKWVIKWNKWK